MKNAEITIDENKSIHVQFSHEYYLKYVLILENKLIMLHQTVLVINPEGAKFWEFSDFKFKKRRPVSW